MINTHSQEILGFEFDNNSEPFSLYNILQCISCFIFQLIEAEVNDQTAYLIYTIVVGVIGFICVLLPYFFKFREEKAHSEASHSVIENIKESMSYPTNNEMSIDHVGASEIDSKDVSRQGSK